MDNEKSTPEPPRLTQPTLTQPRPALSSRIDAFFDAVVHILHRLSEPVLLISALFILTHDCFKIVNGPPQAQSAMRSSSNETVEPQNAPPFKEKDLAEKIWLC